MPFTHTTWRGKTYFLHTGPKRCGGVQHFVSTDPDGPTAEAVPDGFEIHETPNGQVYLRKAKPALIRPDELALVNAELSKPQTSQRCYLAEVVGKEIVIHEGDTHIETLRAINIRFSERGLEEYAARNAQYTAVMRFVLIDKATREFAPERFCFRGSVADWISIGEPAQLITNWSRSSSSTWEETPFMTCTEVSAFACVLRSFEGAGQWFLGNIAFTTRMTEPLLGEIMGNLM